MPDTRRTEARSAFRTLIRDSVPKELHTRVMQLMDAVVFSAEPVLRGLEHFEIRYGTAQPTAGDFPNDGYGLFIDEKAGAAYVCLKWREEFYIIAGTAGGLGEANTASSAGSGVSIYYQKTGVDLEFNAIKSENAYLGVALDATTHDVELTVDFAAIEAAVSHLNIQDIGVNTHAQIDTHVALADPNLDFYNGSFEESFNALVTSDGATVTLAVEQSGGGDLTMRFSDGRTVLDCTPAQTITLTAGTDSAPTINYIYIPQSTKVLTKSTTQWPATEHIKVGYFYVPSATYVQSDGVYINQNWNDHRMGTDSQGHMSHMAEAIRLTMRGATWHSGVAPAAAGSEYLEVTGSSPSVVEFKSTAGVSFQMHKHTIPAIDMSAGDDCLVVNWSGDAFHDVTDLADIVDDATGSSLSNRWFNLVFWGVCNKTGEYAPLMCNLPTGSYVTQANAEADVDGYDVTTIPHEFTADSCTGFLICRVTCKQSPAGTWTLGGTTDLRGVLPGAVAGSAAGGGAITDFSDNLFTIYNVSDVTKILDFDLSGITTGNTRTVTPSDAAMTIPDTTNWTDLTDAGDTTLHGHDVTGLTGWIGPYVETDGTSPLTGDWDAGSFKITAQELSTDTISEETSKTGVTVDGLLIKDGTAYLGNDVYLMGLDNIGAPFAIAAITGAGQLHVGGSGFGTYLDGALVDIPNGPLEVDTINESTAAAGVTIDGVLIKDSNIAAIDYSFVTANDGATDVTAAELEELSDGSTTTLHDHTVTGLTGWLGPYVETDGTSPFTAAVTLAYLAAAPASLANGMIWMESDGLHIYYAGAEKVVAGV